MIFIADTMVVIARLSLSTSCTRAMYGRSRECVIVD